MSNNRPGILSDVTGRLARKRRDQRKRRLRWIWLVSGLLVLTGVAVWVIWFSQLFTVRSVRVEGVNLITSDHVVSVAQVPLGTPVVSFDSTLVIERVSGLAPVASVDVRVGWDGEVVLHVTERVPVFQRVVEKTYTWVDAQGVAFHETGELRPELPQAVVESPNDRIYRDLAIVAGSLTSAIREKMVSIVANSPDTIVIKLANGAELIWGSAEKSELKTQVASALLQVEATVYDVSAPEHPITRR